MKKINITLPESFLAEADRTAKRHKLSRSELFRRAIETYWKEEAREQEERERGHRIARAAKVQDGLRAISGDWDGVAEIRRWREARR